MVQRDVFYPKDEEMQVTGFIFTNTGHIKPNLL